MDETARTELPATDASDRRWLRRSRAIQVLALSVAGVTAAAIAGTTLVAANRSGSALPSPTGLAAVTADASSAQPSASPSQDPLVSPSASVPGNQPGGGGLPNPTGCPPTSAAVAGIGPGPLTFTLAFAPGDWNRARCQGAQIKTFWVSYTVDPGGNLHHFASQVFYLSAANPTVKLTVTVPGTCGYRWYVVVGDHPVKTYVAAADVGYQMLPESGPYWNWTYGSQGAIVSDQRGPCPTPEPSSVSPTPTPSGAAPMGR